MSENGTWFIEEDEMTIEELDEFWDEICELGLDGYIEVDETATDGEPLVTIYGATITKFIY